MRHHDCTQHAHDDEHTSLGDARCHPRLCRQWPIDIHEEQFVQERKADDGYKSDDDALDALVRIREKHGKHKQRGEDGTPHDGDAEKHLQGNGTAQNLGQRSGNGSLHCRTQNGT